MPHGAQRANIDKGGAQRANTDKKGRLLGGVG